MKPNWDPRTEHWGVPRAARVVADYASPVLIGRAFGTEEVDVANALGRITAHDVASRFSIPNHKLAGVRGDALRAEDTYNASETNPVRLEPSGPPLTRGDGHRLPRHLPGEACSTLPYGLLPRGADAVLSDTSPYYQGKRLSEKMRQRIVKPVPSGLDVIGVAADVAMNDMLVYTGRRITPGDIASLCFGGVGRITVFKRPRIALLMVHQFFQPNYEVPEKDALPDAILPMVQAMLTGWGIKVDTVETRELAASWVGPEERTWASAVSTQHDLTICLGMLGTREVVNGTLALVQDQDTVLPDERDADAFLSPHRGLYKPADIMQLSSVHPFDSAHRDRCKLFIGLPGLPLPVMTAMYLFVRPIIDALLGVGGFTMGHEGSPNYRFGGANPNPNFLTPEQESRYTAPHPSGMFCRQGVQWFNGVLASPAPRDAERHALQLARFDHSTPGQTGLHVLPSEEYRVSSLFNAEAMVAIEKGAGDFAAGTPVQYFLLD